jgi:hypothetical protein
MKSFNSEDDLLIISSLCMTKKVTKIRLFVSTIDKYDHHQKQK